MTAAEAFAEAIKEATKARKRVAALNVRQVRGADDLTSLKATTDVWFHAHRPRVERVVSADSIAKIDAPYKVVLAATSSAATKQTYLDALAAAKAALVAAQALSVTAPTAPKDEAGPPDFTPLVGSEEMRGVLTRRWHECLRCVRADAHLAGIVMMGGLLEALFVARANRMPEKRALISSAAAPKDKSGTVINYTEWMLDSYIKVAKELKWITASAGDLADVLKEYRNYVHPAKELRYGVILARNDSSVFWELTKALTEQLLMSAKAT